jgi:transcriptional regulator with XRE-family HTH domain
MRALRNLRVEAGLTQFVVAGKSGVTRTRLSLAESGQLRLSSEEEAVVRGAIHDGIEEKAVRLRNLLSSGQNKTPEFKANNS